MEYSVKLYLDGKLARNQVGLTCSLAVSPGFLQGASLRVGQESMNIRMLNPGMLKLSISEYRIPQKQ